MYLLWLHAKKHLFAGSGEFHRRYRSRVPLVNQPRPGPLIKVGGSPGVGKELYLPQPVRPSTTISIQSTSIESPPENLSAEIRTEYAPFSDIFCPQSVSSPLLVHPYPQKPFTVEVDAFTTGVGAILSQQQGTPPRHHPCAFFSRKLSPTEQNYDISNKELLAIKLALETLAGGGPNKQNKNRGKQVQGVSKAIQKRGLCSVCDRRQVHPTPPKNIL